MLRTEELTVLMKGDGVTNKIVTISFLAHGNQRRLVALELLGYSVRFTAPTTYPSVVLRVENDHFTSPSNHVTKPGVNTPAIYSTPVSTHRLAIDVGTTFTRVDLNVPIVIFKSQETPVNPTSLSIEFLPESQLENIVGLGPVPDLAFLRFRIITASIPSNSLYNDYPSFVNRQ